MNEKWSKFRVCDGIIQGFAIPSELYGTTMTGNISLTDAIKRGEVCTGDGVGFTFSKQQIKRFKGYLKEIVDAKHNYR